MCVDSVSLSLFLSVSVSEHQQTNEQKLTKIEQNFPNCWRRQSFWESYSKGANDAAQSLAVRRNKEAAVRDLFRKAVARLIPLQVNPHPTPPRPSAFIQPFILCSGRLSLASSPFRPSP